MTKLTKRALPPLKIAATKDVGKAHDEQPEPDDEDGESERGSE
jgi:hypothetical protein